MKKYIYIITGCLILLGTHLELIAQKINGVVFEKAADQKKMPLPGVNIYWSGTTKGTVSDPQGQFQISPDQIRDKKLVFSFLGYRKDTITIDSQYSLEIEMKPENQKLNEVVIRDHSGGTYLSKINARDVEVITSKELLRAACCNLSESFETNASVDVSYADAITGAKQIQLLGLSGVYSQVISENVPLIRGLGTSFGLNYIPGPWMESIQVAKGTSSVINGYESITGQINVEYKKPSTSEPLYINIFANEDLRKEFNMNTRYKVDDRLSTMIFAHVEDQQKKFDRNHDQFMDIPQLRSYNFFNRWDYMIPGKYDSRFGIKYLEETRVSGQMGFKSDAFLQDTAGIESLAKPYGMDIRTKRMETFWKNGLIFHTQPYSSLALILSGIYHDQSGFLGLNRYEGLEKSFNANLLYSSDFRNKRHKITTGFSYQFSDFTEKYFRKDFTYLYQTTGIVNDSTLYKVARVHDTLYSFNRLESVPGAFLEYTYSIQDKLAVIAGVRWDEHNQYGSLFTPRLHVRWMLPHDLTVRASVGRGHRAAHLLSENFSLMASQRELYFEDKLPMEEAWNYGINLTKDIMIRKRKMQLDLEYYHTEFTKQIIVDMDSIPSAAYFYRLKNRSYSNSIQAQINYELFTRFNILMAYRVNDVWTTVGDNLKRKPFVNAYKGLVTLSYTLPYDKWKFDVTGQFNGKARIPETTKMPKFLQRDTQSPAYFILMAQVSKKYKNLEVYVGGENLTNFTQKDPITEPWAPYHTHFDTSMVWGPIKGRTLYGGVRWALK